ncbi:MAG: PepSY domain-containing protein [Gammaproteobacteria bacterium]|nr:MAG: PepSY domain-containing protein [Gammaproteobacteria bacterium]
MSHHPHRRQPARLLRSVFLWHRYLGLLAALFVIVLAVTGILLNHTDELKLNEKRVDTPWLLQWYGIPQPKLTQAMAGDHRLISDGERLRVDDRSLVLPVPGRMTAALEHEGLLLVGRRDDLLLVTPEGELIDRLELPVSALAHDPQGRILVKNRQGTFLLDAELSNWQPASTPASPDWQQAEPLDLARQPEIARRWRGRGLPLERVLLDVHSGRILGSWGVWLMDAAALVMLFLAVSGSWIWIDRKRKQRAHRKQRRHKPQPR